MSKVYEIISERIMNAIQTSNTLPWRKPWAGGATMPQNISGRKYNGANFFLLSMLGYSNPVFLTFNQIKQAGGRIREGEEKNHFPVIYWKMLKKTDDKGKETCFPMLRYFLVWNIEQTTVELPESMKVKPQIEFNPIEAAEAIIEGMPNRPMMSSVDGGSRACYFPDRDVVSLPAANQFNANESYYATLFHELVHSTGHASRLNRAEITKPSYFGSHDYSKEELVAELGAAFLCAEAGIDNTLDNSAAYIRGWLAALRNDPKLFVEAAAKATKAANYILNRSNNSVDKDEGN